MYHSKSFSRSFLYRNREKSILTFHPSVHVRYVQKLQKRKDDERMGIFFIVAIVQLDIERQQTHISNNLEIFSSNQKQ